MGGADLRLRPLRAEDEAPFAAAHAAMARDGFTFGLGWNPAMAWSDYRRRLDEQRRGIVPADGWVPATFLVADVGGRLVGRVSVRHELNERLAHDGGHIGYGVLAAHRGRGYATEMLRQSLVVARAVGVDRALLTCDADNAASVRVIERCGGVLERIVPATAEDRPFRRYWIR